MKTLHLTKEVDETGFEELLVVNIVRTEEDDPEGGTWMCEEHSGEPLVAGKTPFFLSSEGEAMCQLAFAAKLLRIAEISFMEMGSAIDILIAE
jgi:hypothetical protein